MIADVERRRAAKESWAVIGAALGVTPAAAQVRFSQVRRAAASPPAATPPPDRPEPVRPSRAGQDAKPAADGSRMRKCLACGEMFRSKGIGNRICRRHKAGEGVGGAV